MTTQTQQPIDEKRSVLLIDPPFQKKFLLFCLTIALAVETVFYLANVFFFWRAARIGVDRGFPAQHPYFEILQSQRTSMNWIFAATSVVSVLLIMTFGLRFSHRIAGPLVNLTNFLSEAASGKPLGQLNFRKGDFFQSLADAATRAVAEKHERREAANS